MSLTAHCIVKNEEYFVGLALRSVADYVDQIIVFDTGSTDRTVAQIEAVMKLYPHKIIFEQKGSCGKLRHTKLRQEQLERTSTDWFMILDGDEIWTRRGIQEVTELIDRKAAVAGCILAPYYLCVGDIFHYSIRGKYVYGQHKIHALARFFKKTSTVAWNLGPYGEADYVRDHDGNLIRHGNYVILSNKYWHASALPRSSKDGEVGLGRHKQVVSYSLKWLGEGFKIREPLPEVFGDATGMKLPLYKSWINSLLLLLYGLRIIKKRVWV